MSDTQEQSFFIGNRSSKELHRSHCAWVRRMSPRNKVNIKSLFEAARNRYDACGHCLKIYNERLSDMYEQGKLLPLWLNSHPNVRDTIVWESADGAIKYSEWPTDKKEALQEAFFTAWIGDPITLTDPPPNLSNLNDDQFPSTVISEDNAWALYIAYVAHCLMVEMKGWLTWSLTEYETRDLLILFDSRQLFKRDNNSGNYGFDFEFTWVIPAPPQFTYEFLLNNNILVANNRFETITHLTQWCRGNLSHFMGGFEAKNVEDQWQYRGFPPVSRVITGTPHIGFPQLGIRNITAGCGGTTFFLRSVLRCVNIPVKSVTKAQHKLTHFVTEGRFLSHGDDPYNQRTKAADDVAIEHLLIDNETFENWFSSDLPKEVHKSNVGKGVDKMIIEHLPRVILLLHCEDIANGKSHPASKVRDFLSKYTLEELEEFGLWEKIEAKIAALGGCENITSD